MASSRASLIESVVAVIPTNLYPCSSLMYDLAFSLNKVQSPSIHTSLSTTNEPHRLIASSVGVAQPSDQTRYGYLSEYESFGETEKEAGDYAEDIAAQMLASSLGIKFDIDKSWDENRQQWNISGQIYKTRNITQTAIGDKKKRWTTVFAAAVLIL